MYVGHGLVVQHLRENKQCGVLEELEPIDENRRYDFNYQQFNYLNKEVQVLPVSIRFFGQVMAVIYTIAYLRVILSN